MECRKTRSHHEPLLLKNKTKWSGVGKQRHLHEFFKTTFSRTSSPQSSKKNTSSVGSKTVARQLPKQNDDHQKNAQAGAGYARSEAETQDVSPRDDDVSDTFPYPQPQQPIPPSKPNPMDTEETETEQQSPQQHPLPIIPVQQQQHRPIITMPQPQPKQVTPPKTMDMDMEENETEPMQTMSIPAQQKQCQLPMPSNPNILLCRHNRNNKAKTTLPIPEGQYPVYRVAKQFHALTPTTTTTTTTRATTLNDSNTKSNYLSHSINTISNDIASICEMPPDHDDASALSLLNEMSPLNASKLISFLTAPSTQWTCELAALLNDFYRVVLPTSSIVELIRFLGTGPMYSSTPFPDQHIMDNCVIYLNTLLNNHGMIHSVACQLDETYWEECLQNLSGDYYTADGDEKRYNHDAVKRQSQTLHVKLCVMKTFVAILQPQIKACVDDPVLVETQPLIRCFVSHRNGVKRALERFVSSTALLLIHHGYWVVGDKDLSLPSKSLDVLKLEPPPEYLVHNTEAYATELFAVLGHVCTCLAWLYQIVEKQSVKLVTRVITHSFQYELRLSKFDPSPFLSETMSKRDYLDCIRFQFALGLTDDLVPGLRSNVADGIGVDMEIWETLQ